MNYKDLGDVLSKMLDLPEFVEIAEPGVKTKGNFGNYPLHLAAGWGDLEAGQILISAGADPDARGEAGYTPLHEAVELNQPPFIGFLLSNGASLKITNDDGLTPLELAKLLSNDEIQKAIENHISHENKRAQS